MLNVLGTFACGHVSRVFETRVLTFNNQDCSHCRGRDVTVACSSRTRKNWSLQLATPSLADHSPPPPDLGRSGRTK